MWSEGLLKLFLSLTAWLLLVIIQLVLQKEHKERFVLQAAMISHNIDPENMFTYTRASRREALQLQCSCWIDVSKHDH